MNQYDQIKEQLKKVRQALYESKNAAQVQEIKDLYLINEDYESTGNITKRYDVAKTVEDDIEDSDIKKDEFEQSYRISGGILIIHGNKKSDTELTSDEKTIFQETMDEFVSEVSESW